MKNRFDLLYRISGDEMQGRTFPDGTKDSLLEPTIYMSTLQVGMYIMNNYYVPLPFMWASSDLGKGKYERDDLQAAVSGYELENHYGRWEKPPFPQGHKQQTEAQSILNIYVSHIAANKREIINFDLELQKLMPPVGHWHGYWPPIQSGYKRGLGKPKNHNEEG